MKSPVITSTGSIINTGHNYRSFHISSKLDFFIGVEMVMCRYALIFVNEIHQSLTSSCDVPFLKRNEDHAVVNVNQHCTNMMID